MRLRTGHLIASLTAVAAANLPWPATAQAHEAQEIVSHGCSEHVGLFPVPRDEVSNLVPDGFAAHDLLGVDPTGQLATLLTVVVRCADVQLRPGPSLADEHTALVLLAVRPPAGLALDGAAFHALPLLTVGESGAFVARARRWGGHAARGAVDLPQDGGTGRATAHAEGAALVLETAAGPALEAQDGIWRMFGVRDGRVVTVTDVSTAGGSESRPLPATIGTEGLGLPDSLTGVGLHAHWREIVATTHRLTGRR